MTIDFTAKNIHGLKGLSQAMVLAKLYLHQSNHFVVLCDNDQSLEALQSAVDFFLKFFGSNEKCLCFPFRPSVTSPSVIEDQDHVYERLCTLESVLKNDKTFILTHPLALSLYTIDKEMFLKHQSILEVNTTFNPQTLAGDLSNAGFVREDAVNSPGQFSARGAIIDVFVPGQSCPHRIEFFDDLIESIRTFEPTTQASLEPVHDLVFSPAMETIIEDAQLPQIKNRFRQLALETSLPPAQRHQIEEKLSNKILSPSMQALVPLFYDKQSTLFDYLNEKTQWVVLDQLSIERELALFKQLDEHFVLSPMTLKPSKHLKNPQDSLNAVLGKIPYMLFESTDSNKQWSVELNDELRTNLTNSKKKEKPLEPLVMALKNWIDQGFCCVLVSSSPSQCDRIKHLIEPYFKVVSSATSHKDLQPSNVYIMQGDLDAGFAVKEMKLAFVSHTEIFGLKHNTTFHEKQNSAGLEQLDELNPSDYVVHIDHGIGQFIKLIRMKFKQSETDFLELQYHGGDKLFLPVYRLNRIHKYIGSDGKRPVLDKMGQHSVWEKTKQKAQKAVEEMAQDLIKLYATRKVAQSVPFDQANESYLTFEGEFAHEETRDQLNTLKDVFTDLESNRPMDRLVCGDVGFGKTEIALRAAFRTVEEGKQVAVLVPTTVLCQQHYETFKNRFANFPINIDYLSRFKTSTEQKNVVQKLKDGNVDIVIGTHRLLSKDVSFNRLGLLVLDEEHRFGVKHKEEIKKYRNLVHVLTLTATPIPRTLQLSMTGIRDLSVINTPPIDRKSIHTYLCKNDDQVIQSAINKELSRNGQVYFLHNRVETLDAMKVYIHKLNPQAKIVTVHGQLQEHELEKRMLQFIRHECDVLLCTTIVESGLDIPNANTIIIHRADMFGLSQLYQLRGRVGRSDRSAYCYLLIPGEDMISKDALKRLKALQRYTDLGSGLKIALHDLEIRGAGNLLGQAQSGHVANIGFEFYTQLLEREIRKLKNEKVEIDFEPEIQTSIPAYIPDQYIPNEPTRLQFYKRLSKAPNIDVLTQIQNELKDRFGPIPPLVQNLFEIIDLKILAKKAGVAKLKLTVDKPIIEFIDQAPISVDVLIKLMKKDKRIKLDPGQKLTLNVDPEIDSITQTKQLLNQLTADQI